MEPSVKPAPHRVHNGLLNRAPIQCAICGSYVATFEGIPVIVDDKASIINFAHPDCCPETR